MLKVKGTTRPGVHFYGHYYIATAVIEKNMKIDASTPKLH